MNINIPQIEDQVDFAFFKAIMDLCVALGYTANEMDDTLYPDTDDGYNKLKQDIENIKSTKGFAIGVFGVGNTDDKGYETYPRIVLASRAFLAGDVGNNPDPVYTKDPKTNTFNVDTLPPRTSDYYLNVHVISGSASQKNLLNGIIANALPKRGYIDLPDVPGRKIFIHEINTTTPEDPERGIMERIYSYEIKDLWESTPVRKPEAVPPINQVDILGNNFETITIKK